MKKSILALTALCLLCFTSLFAQTEINVTLSDDQPSYHESLWKDNFNRSMLDVSVVKGEPDDNGNTEVSLTLTNNNPETSFYMFSKKYKVKELKKKRPRLVYDPSFGSIDPKTLLTDPYQIPEVRYLNDYHIDIAHYNSPVFQFKLQEGETDTCVLPIYRVEEKKGLFSKRLLIKEERTTTLNITVETKIHEDYEEIKAQCEDLFSRISTEMFCRHKLHHPNLEKQKEPYITERDALKERIQLILGQNQWGKNNTNRKRYEALITDLDHLEDKLVDREVEDCGIASKHTSPHKCDYCSWTLKQIYNKFDLYNKKLDNGDVNKDEVINEVKKIYKCYQNGPKNSTNKRKEQQQQYKSRIENLYNKILSY